MAVYGSSSDYAGNRWRRRDVFSFVAWHRERYGQDEDVGEEMLSCMCFFRAGEGILMVFYFLEGKTYEFYKWICGGVHLIFFVRFVSFF